MGFLRAHRGLSGWNLIAGGEARGGRDEGKLTFGLISIMKWVHSRGSGFLSPNAQEKLETSEGMLQSIIHAFNAGEVIQ